MQTKLLRAEEVALLIGVSTQTLNNWYRWKKLHPDHEFASLIPDFVQSGQRQTRYWSKSDIWSLTEFKNIIPHGRNGILGEITQRAYKNRKVNNDNEQS